MTSIDRSTAADAGDLDAEQIGGPHATWTPEAFRAAAHRVVDLMADYLEDVERHAVLPAIEPGSVAARFPRSAPEAPEPLEAILATTWPWSSRTRPHWQHPGFFAYFASTASGPGILGEMLTAALGQNPMLWRTSPSGTELEQVVVGWLRQALGLPAGVRRAPDRHRLDVFADRPRGGPPGGRNRRGGARACRACRRAARCACMPRRRPIPRSRRRA